MADISASPQSEKSSRLLEIFQKLLPLIDSLADKIRTVWVMGFIALIWIGFWCFSLAKLTTTASLVIIGLGIIPILIVLRFWWALEELKQLPEIADQMLGDAKSEIRDSLQGLAAGNRPKLGLLSAGRGLWSLGSLLSSASNIMGSYLSVTTLINPFMLILGGIAIVWTLLMALGSLVLLAFI